MASQNDKENYSVESRIAKENAQPSLNPRESSQDTILIEPQETESAISPRSTPIPDHSSLQSLQGVHVGWDASGVSTAKCDLCHRQRCGTIQKCRECKLSICKECYLAGRLQGDERHLLDPDSITWEAPPPSRKRKSEESGGNGQGAAKKKRGSRRVAVGRGRGGRAASRALRSTPATFSPPAESTPARDTTIPETSPNTAIFEGSPVEPRYSVEPAPYYPQPGQGQQSNIYRSPLPYSLETIAGSYLQHSASGFSMRTNIADHTSSPYSRLLPPLMPRSYPTGTGRLPPLRPSSYISDRSLPPLRFQSTDRTLPPTSDESPLNTRDQRPRNSPDSDDEWPSSSTIHSLGTQLIDAARALHAANPNLPLDECLRDEVEFTWTSPAFARSEPDTKHAFRIILAATYFASVSLHLPSRTNAARKWLCQEERSLCAVGYEPIKSNPLTSFLCGVGVQYLKRA